MRLPAAASTNRFAVLEVDAVEPAPDVKAKKAPLPRRYRRVHQSCSTKEARRGRGARRHEQKKAAKLAAAEFEDIQPPSSTVMTTAKIKTVPRGPSPPQLPEFTFSNNSQPSTPMKILDFSTLPEPKAPKPVERSECRVLQHCRTPVTLTPKRSRFFPRCSTPQDLLQLDPIGKPETVACMLHRSEKGAPDYTPFATNLWNILHPYPTIPELDGKEVPYVHANSLAGFPNELGLSPYADEHPAVNNAPNHSTTFSSTPPQGLDELLEAGLLDLIKVEPAEPLPLPPSTHTSAILHVAEVSTFLMETDGGSPTSAASDAYVEAWEKFLRTHPCLDTGRSVCDPLDVAAVSRLSHGQDSSGPECSTPPAISGEASVPEATVAQTVPDDVSTATEHDEASVTDVDMHELVPFDKLGEVEDEWMLYSASVLPTQRTARNSASVCDDKDSVNLLCDRRPAWDDVFPTKASTVREWNFDRNEDEITSWADTDGYEWDWGDADW